jgi:hypothetical protein
VGLVKSKVEWDVGQRGFEFEQNAAPARATRLADTHSGSDGVLRACLFSCLALQHTAGRDYRDRLALCDTQDSEQRGAANKKSTDPPSPIIRLFFSWLFF